MPLFSFDEKYKEEGQILPYYIGPLSTYAEWHANQVGLRYSLDPRYEGIPEDVYNPDSDIYNADVDKEGHYASQAYIAGEYSKYGMTLAVLALSGESAGCGEVVQELL